MLKAFMITIALVAAAAGVAMGCSHTGERSANVGEASPKPVNSLESHKWELTTIGNDQIKTGDGETPFLSFDKEKGSAGGNTGCNVFGGSYEVTSESSIRIYDTISTMRACIEDDRMAVERKFMDALLEVDRFVVDGEALRLYKGEEMRLEFRGVAKPE